MVLLPKGEVCTSFDHMMLVSDCETLNLCDHMMLLSKGGTFGQNGHKIASITVQ